MKLKEKVGIFIIALVVIIVALTGTMVNFLVDLQWFSNLGYMSAFLVKIKTYALLGLPLWALSGLVFSVYFLWVEKQYFKLVHVIVNRKDKENKIFKRVAVSAALAITFLLSLLVTSQLWFDLQRFINATSFSQVDPLFQKDISFYVFQLPFYNALVGYGALYLSVLAICTGAIFMFLMMVKPPTDVDLSQFANVRTIGDFAGVAKKGLVSGLIVKVGMLGFMLFILLIPYYWLARYNLVYSPRGVVYGPSYTDIHILLPSYIVLMAISFLGAIAFLYGLLRKRYRFMLVGPVGLITVTLVFTITAAIVQNLIVEPDELSKERQYLEYNIDFTRQAFGLEDIEEIDYDIQQNLTLKDLEENSNVMQNIRINDYRPMLQTYNQIQGIRLYYEFNDIDTDRYVIDGKSTQVLLSARELNSEKLQVQTWQNKHIKFTHGYGIALSPVNTISEDGLPKLLIKNIPPESSTDVVVSQPEIYFGELTDDYIIVNTKEKEFDYPKGSDNQETMYAGQEGISLNFWNRLLFSFYERDLRLLTSSIITSDSLMILRRNIVERLNILAPFLQFDTDPYIVIDQSSGRLFWIVDGYTYSNAYPYSQPYDGSVNYFKNSVKAVIDAYTGQVSLYNYDEADPLLTTYSKIYPGLIKAKSEFPTGLLAHVRYPRTMLQVQAEVNRKYHMLNPSVFYNGEDMWAIGTELYMDAGEVQPVQPDYAMYELPGSDTLEYLLTLPYTPKEKPNLTSLFVARSDGENYGKLALIKFPKDRTVTGPAMLESKIDQDSVISPQLTLWDQKGSIVLRGNILTIPIRNNLLYVEPIYLQAQNQESLPQLKQVVVAYGDKIIMDDTLESALAQIFSSKVNGQNETKPTTDSQSPQPSTDANAQPLSDEELNALIEQIEMQLKGLTQTLEQLKNELKKR